MACIIISAERMTGITATSVSAVLAMDFSSSYVCPIAPEDRPFFRTNTESFETVDNNYIMLQ